LSLLTTCTAYVLLWFSFTQFNRIGILRIRFQAVVLNLDTKIFYFNGTVDLYSSPNKVRVIKSRRMRWAGCVVRMGEERGVYRVLVGNRRESDHWGDLGVDGWIIL